MYEPETDRTHRDRQAHGPAAVVAGLAPMLPQIVTPAHPSAARNPGRRASAAQRKRPSPRLVFMDCGPGAFEPSRNERLWRWTLLWQPSLSAARTHRAISPCRRRRSIAAAMLSVLVLARDGSILRGFLSADGKWRLPVEPDKVDPLYRRMLIAAEDRALCLASRRRSARGAARLRPARGQRACRFRRIDPDDAGGAAARTPTRARSRQSSAKWREALALERRLGKDEMLGLYLTLAPFGGNLEGVRAASLAYFGKEPAHLSPAEAALLVALAALAGAAAPRPASRGGARRRATRVLARMARSGRDLAQRARRGARRARAAAAARHAVSCAASRARHCATTEPAAADPSHDDRSAVAAAGRSAAAAAKPLALDPRGDARRDRRRQPRPAGRRPMSATPISTAVARHGTLDMARAVRSPGSALKPFIYAMAFDRLIIHPETVLEDRPRHFGDYAPSDFDGRFQGDVSAARGVAIFAEPAGRRGARPARAEPVYRGARRCRRQPAPARADRRSRAGDGAGRRRASRLTDLARSMRRCRMAERSRRCAIGADDPPAASIADLRTRSPPGMSTTSWPRRRRRPASCRPRSAAAGDLPSRPAPPTASAISGRSATIRR